MRAKIAASSSTLRAKAAPSWFTTGKITLLRPRAPPAGGAEAGWTPLIPTPPYLAFSSNMTCIGTGASRMLANVLGSDAQTFTATWYRADDTIVFSQPYTSLFQLGNDEAHSRIWGGIHYRFDIEASQVPCAQVADYLFDNYMRPNRPARH
jgi:hypothetical protein